LPPRQRACLRCFPARHLRGGGVAAERERERERERKTEIERRHLRGGGVAAVAAVPGAAAAAWGNKVCVCARACACVVCVWKAVARGKIRGGGGGATS
jgi:hypothetical protein